jgi:hypothetical protein
VGAGGGGAFGAGALRGGGGGGAGRGRSPLRSGVDKWGRHGHGSAKWNHGGEMIPVPIIGVKPPPMRITAGSGLKTRRIGRKHVLYSVRKRTDFSGRFHVNYDVEAGEVTVGVGRVNEYEPEIAGVPISGLYPDGTPYAEGVPRLAVSGDVSICLKITPNQETGRLDAGSDGMAAEGQLTIVAEAGPIAQGVGPSWYQTLARVSPYGFVAQYAYFNYW